MDLLKTLEESAADLITEIGERYDADAAWSDEVKDFEGRCKMGAELDDFLRGSASSLEDLSDDDLNSAFYEKYTLNSAEDGLLTRQGALVSKVNHGFWEHLIYLYASQAQRKNLRDVNLSLRQRQYFEGGFLSALLSAWGQGQSQSAYHQFVSLTSGIAAFSNVFPVFSGKDNKLGPVQRGACKCLIIAADVFRHGFSASEEKFSVFDSYFINSSFENRKFIPMATESYSTESTCLIIGPPSLSKLKIKEWKGKHAYMAISESKAMGLWRFHLDSLIMALDKILDSSDRVLILFQGAVLSPIFCAYLAQQNRFDRSRVNFFDLGRLLDLDAGVPGSNRFSSPQQIVWRFESIFHWRQ